MRRPLISCAKAENYVNSCAQNGATLGDGLFISCALIDAIGALEFYADPVNDTAMAVNNYSDLDLILALRNAAPKLLAVARGGAKTIQEAKICNIFDENCPFCSGLLHMKEALAALEEGK